MLDCSTWAFALFSTHRLRVRFDQDSVVVLMEAINATRERVWKEQPRGFLSQAFIDTDGTIAPTLGQCKGGMALSYKGIWGYAPLIISLANTREVLYLVNRPGNALSHEGCVPWIDRAIELVRPYAGEITLRGDTDFTLSAAWPIAKPKTCLNNCCTGIVINMHGLAL